MKKILITGASGFVGSHLVEEALRRNLDVYAGVRKTSSRQFLKDKRINFFEMNFADVADMTEKLKAQNFNYIIHNAGVVSAPKLEDYYRVNCEYVKNFTQAIYDSKSIPEKFIFISSLAATGPASNEDLSDFLKLDGEPQPINAYGKSKLAAEKHLESLSGFPYINLRLTAVYGPREKEILTFFKLLNKGIEGYIGNKKQHLTFLYVKDLAKLVMDAVFSQHIRKTYFVSDGNHHPASDLGKYGKQFLNKKTVRFHVPLGLVRGIAYMLENIGKVTGSYPPLNLEKVHILSSMNWKCDIEPTKRDFNFQPQYDLEKGLEETLEWYKKINGFNSMNN